MLNMGGGNQSTDLDIYYDADWGSNGHEKSMSRYIIKLGGAAVAWSSKKQITVALSTAVAEYMAATHVAKQVLWFRSLFSELLFAQPSTSMIQSDNQEAITISHHPEFHSRMKHIDISLHFL